MEKTKIKVYEYELDLNVTALEEGGFLAASKKLQGVLAEGKTISEAIENATDVAKNVIEIMKENNKKIPLTVIRKNNFQTKVSVLALA